MNIYNLSLNVYQIMNSHYSGKGQKQLMDSIVNDIKSQYVWRGYKTIHAISEEYTKVYAAYDAHSWKAIWCGGSNLIK